MDHEWDCTYDRRLAGHWLPVAAPVSRITNEHWINVVVHPLSRHGLAQLATQVLDAAEAIHTSHATFLHSAANTVGARCLP